MLRNMYAYLFLAAVGIPCANAQYYEGGYIYNAFDVQETLDGERMSIEEFVARRTEMNLRIGAMRREERMRKKKFFAAVLMRPANLDNLYWSAGHRDATKAVSQAKKTCGEDCVEMAVYSNTCLMLAEPTGNTDISRIVVAYDPMPEQAIQKAKEACTDKYGTDCVAYEQLPGAEHRAYCVGYDYGVYDDGR